MPWRGAQCGVVELMGNGKLGCDPQTIFVQIPPENSPQIQSVAAKLLTTFGQQSVEKRRFGF